MVPEPGLFSSTSTSLPVMVTGFLSLLPLLFDVVVVVMGNDLVDGE